MKIGSIVNNIYKKLLFLGIVFSLFYACVEPYDFKSETYDKLLVVEGTVTNEMKNQVISLSYVYRIDNDTIIPESNAQVSVIDDAQNVFEFWETEEGTYESIDQFRIVPNRQYHLEITTSNGKTYMSEEETLPENNAVMEELYAERAVNNEGIEGIAIYSSSTNLGNEGVSYYKYSYSETYKIVSPYTSNRDLIINDSGGLEIVPKTKEEEICYKTRKPMIIMKL